MSGSADSPTTGNSLLTEEGAEQIVRGGHARFDLSSGSVPLAAVGLSGEHYTHPVTTDKDRPFTVDFVGSKGTFTVKGSTLHAMTFSTKDSVQTFEVFQSFGSTSELVDALERDGAKLGVPAEPLAGLVASLRAAPDARTQGVTQVGEALGFAASISVRIPEGKPGRTLVYTIIPADVYATYPKNN